MKKKLTIVGGGACALMLACELDHTKFDVSVFEKNAAPGRKFLVAGEGGLNITHSENEAAFLEKYTPSGFLKAAFTHFSNKDLVRWFNTLGIETYVGSSGRVFPKRGIKPIAVLNVILEKIKRNNVSIYTKHEWKDFSGTGKLVFKNTKQLVEIESDIVVFGLGGASWPITGSNGNWTKQFLQKNILIDPFQASNCAFKILWPDILLSKIAGKALKNISISYGDKTYTGEIVITKFGMEGSGIYPLSPAIRSALKAKGQAEISIDLKPALSEEKIVERIKQKPVKRSLTEHIKSALNLSEAQVLLLKHVLTKDVFLNAEQLSKRIKNFRLIITDTAQIEEAISTVGGVNLEEVDAGFQLKKLPGYFVVGEMLNYDAPTGGYLLQSCFSMANYLAKQLNADN